MTKKEAIKMLKSKMDGHTDTSYEWAETVRMAIEALEHEERMDSLKPCPFCGSDARVTPLYKHGFISGVAILYQISCDGSCKVNPSVTADTIEEAVREWNRRVEG